MFNEKTGNGNGHRSRLPKAEPGDLPVVPVRVVNPLATAGDVVELRGALRVATILLCVLAVCGAVVATCAILLAVNAPTTESNDSLAQELYRLRHHLEANPLPTQQPAKED